VLWDFFLSSVVVAISLMELVVTMIIIYLMAAIENMAAMIIMKVLVSRVIMNQFSLT